MNAGAGDVGCVLGFCEELVTLEWREKVANIQTRVADCNVKDLNFFIALQSNSGRALSCQVLFFCFLKF